MAYKGGWWTDEQCPVKGCGCRVRTDGLDKWCSSIHCNYNVDVRKKKPVLIILKKKPIVVLSKRSK